MVGAQQRRDQRFIKVCVAFKADDAFFNGVPEPGTDLKGFMGGASIEHGQTPGKRWWIGRRDL
jgi:hypothetical protein